MYAADWSTPLYPSQAEQRRAYKGDGPVDRATASGTAYSEAAAMKYRKRPGFKKRRQRRRGA
jgi:hypothetical protein